MTVSSTSSFSSNGSSIEQHISPPQQRHGIQHEGSISHKLQDSGRPDLQALRTRNTTLQALSARISQLKNTTQQYEAEAVAQNASSSNIFSSEIRQTATGQVNKTKVNPFSFLKTKKSEKTTQQHSSNANSCTSKSNYAALLRAANRNRI